MSLRVMVQLFVEFIYTQVYIFSPHLSSMCGFFFFFLKLYTFFFLFFFFFLKPLFYLFYLTRKKDVVKDARCVGVAQELSQVTVRPVVLWMDQRYCPIFGSREYTNSQWTFTFIYSPTLFLVFWIVLPFAWFTYITISFYSTSFFHLLLFPLQSLFESQTVHVTNTFSRSFVWNSGEQASFYTTRENSIHLSFSHFFPLFILS